MSTAYVQQYIHICTVVGGFPLFTGETIGVDPKTGDIHEDAKPFENWAELEASSAA